MLKEMKRDMDSVFKKLRYVKQRMGLYVNVIMGYIILYRKIKHKLELKYPNEMEQVKKRYPPPIVQDDD